MFLTTRRVLVLLLAIMCIVFWYVLPRSVVSAASVAFRCAALDAKERTSCLEEEVPALYPSSSVEEIFDLIRFGQKVDSAFIDCHFIAHRLGEEVVAQDPSRWNEFVELEPSDSLCAFGYIHGVTIGAYRDEALSDAEIDAEIPKFREACTSDRFRRRTNCFHGMGHMFYYVAGGDVQKGLNLCDRVASPTVGDLVPDDKRRCYSGVTMKIFFSFIGQDLEDPNPYNLTRENYRAFCNSLDLPGHRGACLRAGWTIHLPEILTGALVDEVCSGQPNANETTWCYHKVYNGLGWKLIQTLDKVHAVCQAARDERALICYEDVSAAILGETGNAAIHEMVDLCLNARPAFVDGCLSQLAERSGMFTDVGSPAHKRYCSAFSGKYREMCIRSSNQ